MASEEEVIGRNEFESAVTGDPGGTESEYCEASCDASSDSTQFYDSDGQLLNMKEKNKDKNEKTRKKRKKKKSSPIRWAKKPDSGFETWEWKPEPEEEISLHAVHQERSLLQQDVDTIEAVKTEKEDTVGELQKKFDCFRIESKKIDDKIDQM